MTREEAIVHIKDVICENNAIKPNMVVFEQEKEALYMAIKVLEQEPCDDCISREAARDLMYHKQEPLDEYDLDTLPSVTPKPKTGRCKDCKWWKDSDGTFRRGVRAESHCPINRKEVFEGNGYCYLFEPQESGVSNADSN